MSRCRSSVEGTASWPGTNSTSTRPVAARVKPRGQPAHRSRALAHTSKETVLMAESENAALVRRWFEDVWNTRREATVHELLDAAAVGHLEGLVTHGVAEFLAARTFILSAFPDFHITLEDTAAQDDNVAVRWSAKGT